MRLILSLILLATISFAAPTPINNLLLQGNENANGYSITNLVVAGLDSAATVSYVSNAVNSIVIPAAPVQSVNGKTGTVVLTYSDVGADIEGSALGVFNWVQLQNYVDKSVTNGLASTNYVNSKIPYVPVLSINSKTGDVVLSANDVNADIFGAASAVSNWVVMQSYVDKTVTNGLASISFVTSQGYVTAIITNGLVAQSSLTSQLLNYYLNSNPSNYVTKVITNGLASVSYVNSQGFVTANITNGLASVSWIQSQNYVDHSITNGLATTNYVNSAIAALPPSVGNVVSVNSKTGVVVLTSSDIGAYPDTNPNNYVDKSVTNGLYSASNPANYVDKSITNGLASVSWVQLQNYVTQSITNGLASISQLSGMVTQNMDNVTFGSNTTFNGDIWVIGNIYVKNIWTTNSIINTTNMNITGTLTVNGNSVLTNYSIDAYSNYVDSTYYKSSNPNNYVDKSVTNGLYSASNPANYVDKSITNGLVATNDARILNAITNNYANVVNFTNRLFVASGGPTNGLLISGYEFAVWPNISSYPHFRVANDGSIGTPNWYVDANGVDHANGVQSTARISWNGNSVLTNYSIDAYSNYVDSTYYKSSNPNNYVDKTVTNGLASISYVTNQITLATNGLWIAVTNLNKANIDVNNIVLSPTYGNTNIYNLATNYTALTLTNTLAIIPRTNMTTVTISNTNWLDVLVTSDNSTLYSVWVGQTNKLYIISPDKLYTNLMITTHNE